MSSLLSGGVRLDMIVYIGIAVDVALAIVAGVMVYWWKSRKSEKSKRLSHTMVGHRENVRADLATMSLTNEDDNEGVPSEEYRQVNAVQPIQREKSEPKDGNGIDAERVAGNFAFLNSPSTQSENLSTENEADDVKSSRRSRVIIIDPKIEGDIETAHYPANSDERVIHNPLTGSVRQYTSVTGVDEDQDSPRNEDIDVSTYYTYNAAANQQDGDTSEIISEGEKAPESPIPPPPPPEIQIDPALTEPGTGSDVESPHTPSPPPPPGDDSEGSGGMIPNPLYHAADSISDGRSDVAEFGEDVRSTSTMNFGEEDVARLYNTELDESTEIM